jgi:hypothetical protein
MKVSEPCWPGKVFHAGGDDMKKTNRVRKHRRDKNNGKNGWVGGNPRYDRRKATEGKNRSMGRN